VEGLFLSRLLVKRLASGTCAINAFPLASYPVDTLDLSTFHFSRKIASLATPESREAWPADKNRHDAM
jgi:hypothetical protein